MPDTDIERTIFKLELDGSGYVQGVDNLTNSTKKLSDAQEKANKNLALLQKQERELKKTLQETTSVLQANEKETLDLTKALNDLKTAGKGASVEAKNLQSQLRGLATNTKEFKIEAAELKTRLADTNNQLKIQTKELAASEKATGGFTKGLSGAYTGLSKIAQIIPGLGIGGLIGLIAGPLVGALKNWVGGMFDVNEALDRTARRQKIVTDITNESIKSSTGDIVRLDLIKQKLDDLSLPQKQRIELAKEYNKTADEGNKIDLKQIDNIDLINIAIDKQIAKIKERALTRAAENIITLKSEALLLAQEESRVKNAGFAKQVTTSITGEKGNLMEQYVQGLEEKKVLAQQISKDPTVIKAQQELDDALAAGSKFITIGGLTTKITADKTKTAADKKALESDFEKRKADLLAQISALAESAFESEVTIRKKFKDKLDKALLSINEDKSLKKGEGQALKLLAGQLNEGELNKALNDFRKKITDARQKLNDELKALQDKNVQDNLNLIQEEFDRRAKLIDFNEKRELENSQASTKKRLDALDLERLLIGEKAYQDAKAALIESGEQAALIIIQRATGQRKDLAADIFQSLLDQYDNAIKAADLVRDEQTAKDVTALAEKLRAGIISYENFQKEIKRIQKTADRDSKEGTLAVDRDKLQELDRQLQKILDKNSAGYKKLKKQRDEQASKVAKEETALAKDQDAPEADPRFARVAQYAEAIGNLTASIISFWQKANEAEAKALDRSIALQEKRVEAAQRIAARGNAQYLKEEEDRLKELTIKRENAARRELGINAALQASQLLVGITGAIAKIAQGGGIAEVIGAIAVIFGALSTGYRLVKSLQGAQPKLFVGTTDTGTGGNQDSQGGFTATLHPHEAVIPADTNKAYHPTVAAIYDKTIPPEEINRFVQNYHKIKPVPQPNYERIRETAEISINENGRMAYLLTENNRKLDEQNELQRLTLKAMKHMSVSANIDRNGVAISVNEYITQMNIDKKV